jgi:type II pantothenate kinase
MFAGGKSVDFHDVRHRLKPRPWRCDDLDAWLDRLAGPPHARALVFIDNAGPDIVLGMIPFCRELLIRGTRVMMAANSAPSLNDVTALELVDLLEKARVLDASIDAALAEGRLTVEASGNWAPLIDFKLVSPALVAKLEADPVDLLVIEGMGRAIETNFDARFTCETVKLAMIKDRGVASAIGGELYDLVFRYEA